MAMSEVWAILVAAGRGERLAADRPKAFVAFNGRPLLAESLSRLDANESIDNVVVVAPVGWEEPAILCAEEESASKVVACVTGGDTRADSVRAGVAEVPDEARVILIHDAARPLVTEAVVSRVLEALDEHGIDGAVPGLAIPDTIKRIIEAEPHTRFDRAHFLTIADSAFLVQAVYYMIDPDAALYRDTQERINLPVLRAFTSDGITLAYPTQSIHLLTAPGAS